MHIRCTSKGFATRYYAVGSAEAAYYRYHLEIVSNFDSARGVDQLREIERTIKAEECTSEEFFHQTRGM